MNLLPCPFCGATPKVTHIGNWNTKKRSVCISCPDCRVQRTDATLRNSFEWLENVAEAAWNKRTAQL
jgi:hypothetical protein